MSVLRWGCPVFVRIADRKIDIVCQEPDPGVDWKSKGDFRSSDDVKRKRGVKLE